MHIKKLKTYIRIKRYNPWKTSKLITKTNSPVLTLIISQSLINNTYCIPRHNIKQHQDKQEPRVSSYRICVFGIALPKPKDALKWCENKHHPPKSTWLRVYVYTTITRSIDFLSKLRSLLAALSRKKSWFAYINLVWFFSDECFLQHI